MSIRLSHIIIITFSFSNCNTFHHSFHFHCGINVVNKYDVNIVPDQPVCFFLSQTVNWRAPVSVSRGRVRLAEDTLSNTAPPLLFGRARTHAVATELWDGNQRERSRRQDLDPQQPALPAQPDSADSRSDSRKTHTGTSDAETCLFFNSIMT